MSEGGGDTPYKLRIRLSAAHAVGFGSEGRNRAPLGTNDKQLCHILQVIQADCVTIEVFGFHLVC